MKPKPCPKCRAPLEAATAGALRYLWQAVVRWRFSDGVGVVAPVNGPPPLRCRACGVKWVRRMIARAPKWKGRRT
jgi:hypothetical protein